MSEDLRTLEELGKEIVSRRKKKCMSLPDVSEKTKIRIQFLEAIEKGDVASLPGALYARGFIKTYLELLESLDLWSECETNLKKMSPEKSKESVVQYFPTQKGFQKVSSLWIFVFLFFAIGISLYMIWQQKDALTAQMRAVPDITQSNPDEEKQEGAIQELVTPVPQNGESEVSIVEVEAVTTNTDSADIPAQQPDTSWIPGVDESASQETPGPKTGLLTIKSSGSCWLSVSQDGGNTSQKTLSRGETFEAMVEKRTTVRFGNAGAVILQWGGKEIRNLGRTGEVVTIVLLPDGTLKRL